MSFRIGPTDLQGRLLFAVPKKGRLNAKCITFLDKIGIKFVRAHRLDIALCSNLNIALVFLPAADIPLYVSEGRVDLGITGQDMIAEKNAEGRVKEELQLGFGHCRLCVQAPVSSNIKDAKELIGKRIVTSFTNMSKKFFDELGDTEGKTQITYAAGSVEAACPLGIADAVVDLVESGETMRAAGLEVVDTVLSTEAVLLSNVHSGHEDLLKKIVKRFHGAVYAQKYVVVEYNVHKTQLEAAKTITPGKRSPTISNLEDNDYVAVKVMVARSAINNVLDDLEALEGVSDILQFSIDNCRA